MEVPMRKHARLLTTVTIALLLASCRGEIPMVGLDKDGKQIETMVRREKFEESLTLGLNDLQDSAVPALDNAPNGKEWFLREVRLGLGVQGSIGLGDYFKLGGNIGFRLCFANKT